MWDGTFHNKYGNIIGRYLNGTLINETNEVKRETVDTAFTIQVYASRKHENAKKLVEKLKGNGFEDAFIFKHTAGNNTLHRVRVGKVSRSEANELANRLKNLKYIESVQITRF